VLGCKFCGGETTTLRKSIVIIKSTVDQEFSIYFLSCLKDAIRETAEGNIQYN